jgi:hypothetical protein
MSSAHDIIISFVTGPRPGSLAHRMEKEIRETEGKTRSVEAERVSPDAASERESSEDLAVSTRVKEADRPAPVSEREYSEDLPMLTQVKEADASSSSTPSSVTDGGDDENTAQVSQGEAKPGRVDRKSKPFVATSKDPRATPPPPVKTGRVDRNAKSFVASSKDPRATTSNFSTCKPTKRGAESNVPSAKSRVLSSNDLSLTYNTIKCTNMPARPASYPAPVNGTFPFSDTEDYNNSMVIYFLDELEHIYGQTTKLYNLHFPK